MEHEVVPCQRTFFPWSHFHGSISKKCILKPLGPLLGVIERGPKEANMHQNMNVLVFKIYMLKW